MEPVLREMEAKFIQININPYYDCNRHHPSRTAGRFACFTAHKREQYKSWRVGFDNWVSLQTTCSTERKFRFDRRGRLRTPSIKINGITKIPSRDLPDDRLSTNGIDDQFTPTPRQLYGWLEKCKFAASDHRDVLAELKISFKDRGFTKPSHFDRPRAQPKKEKWDYWFHDTELFDFTQKIK